MDRLGRGGESAIEVMTPDSSPDRGGVRLSPQISSSTKSSTESKSKKHQKKQFRKSTQPMTDSPTMSEITSHIGSSNGGLEVLHTKLQAIHSFLAAVPSLDGPHSSPDPVTDIDPNRSIAMDSISRLADLPRHIFLDASRSAPRKIHTPEPPTTDHSALDGVRNPQEDNRPSLSRNNGVFDEDIRLQPPAYTARLAPQRGHQLLSSRVHRFLTPLMSEKTGQVIIRGLRKVFLDILFLVFTLSLTGALLKWAPLWHRKDRLFPMTFDPVSGTWLGPVEYSYPRHNFYLGIFTTGVMIPSIPIAVMIVMQYWIRSFLDLSAVSLAFLKALTLMLFIQTILKLYIGEFRPWFISACNPDPIRLTKLRAIQDPGRWPVNSPRVYVDPTYCRGRYDDVTFAMTSFPSGHTSEAFMAGTFLALYLNAKLKPFSDYHTDFWKMMLVVTPLIGSMFIAGSLVADRNHHNHDIILSIPLGIFVAVLAYRTQYASLFNDRTNHLPLPFSNTHQSLHPITPGPSVSNQDTRLTRILKPRNENFTATAWPREPKSYGQAHNDQGRFTPPTAQGADGIWDHASPMPPFARDHTPRRTSAVLRRNRMRVEPYPLRVGRVTPSSPVGRDTDTELDGPRSSGESTAIGPDGQGSLGITRRMTVDEWARPNPEVDQMV